MVSPPVKYSGVCVSFLGAWQRVVIATKHADQVPLSFIVFDACTSPYMHEVLVCAIGWRYHCFFRLILMRKQAVQAGIHKNFNYDNFSWEMCLYLCSMLLLREPWSCVTGGEIITRTIKHVTGGEIITRTNHKVVLWVDKPSCEPSICVTGR